MYFDPMTGLHFPVSSSASLFLAGIWAFVKTAASPSLSELASYGERLSPISLARSWSLQTFSGDVSSLHLSLPRAVSCFSLQHPSVGLQVLLAASSWTLLVLSGPTGANHASQVREIGLWGASLVHVTRKLFTGSSAEGHLWTRLLWVRDVKQPVTTSVQLLLALCWPGWLQLLNWFLES